MAGWLMAGWLTGWLDGWIADGPMSHGGGLAGLLANWLAWLAG